MARLGEAVVRIRADLRSLKSGLAKAFNVTRRAMAKITRIARNTAIAILGIGIASIKMAADAEESENLFVESMGNMGAATRRWSDAMADALGLNSFNIRKFVSVFNVMLKSMGLGETEATNMAKSLTELAFDMASFFNLKPAEAFQKLQAGITGEIEPLKRLGIIVNETQIKQSALNRGIIEQGQVLTETQKIQERYVVIMKQTTAAQGDLARTSDSITNVFRSLRSTIAQVAIEIGTEFIDVTKDAIKAVRDWLVDNKSALVEWAAFFALKLEETITKVKEFLSDLQGDDFKTAFKDAMEKLKPIAEEAGQALGRAIVKGMGKAITGVPGFAAESLRQFTRNPQLERGFGLQESLSGGALVGGSGPFDVGRVGSPK